MDDAAVRTLVIERKLHDVEQLPATEALRKHKKSLTINEVESRNSPQVTLSFTNEFQIIQIVS